MDLKLLILVSGLGYMTSYELVFLRDLAHEHLYLIAQRRVDLLEYSDLRL